MKNKVKIGACIMVHNMAPFIGACVHSLNWVDGLYIFDDKSTDNSAEIAKQYSKIPIIIEKSRENDMVFKKGELKTRNYILDRAFNLLNVDVLIIADADELFSENLKSEILNYFSNSTVDSMSFSIWHLFDKKRYIHFWEDTINNVKMIDPHTRVVRRNKKFIPLSSDGSHPIIEANKNTVCLHGPHHFHLKYFYKSTLPNYSIFFLPERFSEEIVSTYLKKLPFDLPQDIDNSINLVDWDNLPLYKETPHYLSKRIIFDNPDQALLHPKYYKG